MFGPRHDHSATLLSKRAGILGVKWVGKLRLNPFIVVIESHSWETLRQNGGSIGLVSKRVKRWGGGLLSIIWLILTIKSASYTLLIRQINI